MNKQENSQAAQAASEAEGQAATALTIAIPKELVAVDVAATQPQDGQTLVQR